MGNWGVGGGKLFWLGCYYTPLYEKGIKNRNNPMETTRSGNKSTNSLFVFVSCFYIILYSVHSLKMLRRR